MASVVIAGDVSGTCTLQAANAAGTTVLSLPTTSGTLVATNGSPTFVTVTSTTDNTTTLNATTGNITTVTAGLGNATAPSITFTGDTNTGIFSPGADSIGFAEGGAEVMRIDSSGNVGIGETSPAGSANYRQLVIRGTNGAELSLKAGATQYGYIYGDSGGLRIINPQSGASSGTMQFFTSNTERMRITNDGLLQFNSGYGSVATAYGCRAWVNFDGGNGNTAGTINANGNVSSITVNGTGDYTVNFTSAMPDGNYSAVVSGQREASGGNISHIANISNSTTNFQTTYIRVGFANDAGGSTNARKMCVSVFR